MPACPRCGNELTGGGSGDGGDDHIIAVLGATDAGKTHYLATLYHQLVEAPEPAGGDVWELEIDDDVRDALRDELWSPLFVERRELQATPAGDRLPFELVLHHRPSARRVLLAFEDLAGEVLEDRKRLEREEFLHHARGIVLLADPLALDPASPYPTCVEILGDYLHALDGSRYRRHRPTDPEIARLLPLEASQKTLAIAITKADLVLADPNDPFWSEPGPNTPDDTIDPLAPGYWNARAAESERAWQWLLARVAEAEGTATEGSRAARDLTRQTEKFADVATFFVSSTGYAHRPHSGHLREEPRPRRVAEPLFALLDRFADLSVPAPAEPVERAESASLGGRHPRGDRPADRSGHRDRPAAPDTPEMDDTFLPEEL